MGAGRALINHPNLGNTNQLQNITPKAELSCAQFEAKATAWRKVGSLKKCALAHMLVQPILQNAACFWGF